MCDYIYDTYYQKWGNKSYPLFEYEKSLSLSYIQTGKQKNSQLISKKSKRLWHFNFLQFPNKVKGSTIVILPNRLVQSGLHLIWATFSLNNLQTLLRQECLCLSIFINKKRMTDGIHCLIGSSWSLPGGLSLLQLCGPTRPLLLSRVDVFPLLLPKLLESTASVWSSLQPQAPDEEFQEHQCFSSSNAVYSPVRYDRQKWSYF